jgi:molybdenum cofactor biosynthesis enzyme
MSNYGNRGHSAAAPRAAAPVMPLRTQYGAGARAVVRMSHDAAACVARGDLSPFDAVAAACLVAHRIAEPAGARGQSAAIDPRVEVEPEAGCVTVTVRARGRPGDGCEVQAMAACMGAALTLYDLVKDRDAAVLIDAVELLHGAEDLRRRPGGTASEWTP